MSGQNTAEVVEAVLRQHGPPLGMGDQWEGWHPYHDRDYRELAEEIVAALEHRAALGVSPSLNAWRTWAIEVVKRTPEG
jgi:hypothetical protein